MKYLAIIIIVAGVLSAQEPQSPTLPLPGDYSNPSKFSLKNNFQIVPGRKPQKKKKPLEILKEVQKKMEEISQGLSQGSIDRPIIDKKKLEKAIKNISSSKHEQKQLAQRLAKLLAEKRSSQKDVQEEIEKLLQQKDLGNLKNKLEALQKLQANRQRQEDVDRLIERLLTARKQQKKALEKIQKMMKHCGICQKNVEKEIQKLMDSLARQKKAADMIDKMMRSIDKQQKAVKKIDQLFRQLEKRQKKVVKDIDLVMRMAEKYRTKQSMSSPPKSKPKSGKKEPKKKTEKQNRGNREKEKKDNKKDQPNKPQDDNDRWGHLPPRVREYINAMRKLKMPEKYRKEILEYYRRMAETK